MKNQKFGTREWAAKNVNIISGCEHDCLYCYAKDIAVRFKRKTKENWTTEVLNHKKINKGWRYSEGKIMFPSSHDITPSNLPQAILVLKKLLNAGNKVLIVTKPHLKVVESLTYNLSDYKKQILFRFTIGSTNSNTLKFWEPNATAYNERKESLIHAYKEGFETSISAEPMLDNNMDDLIKDLSPYVTESIWLGKMNQLVARLKRTGSYNPLTAQKAKELSEMQSDENILRLYNRHKHNSLIKWKESIKKVAGI